MSITGKLSKLHEDDIAEWLEGHSAPASGSQWHDQADGRQNRYKQEFAWAWDCKCAMPGTKSIGVTREMLHKLIEQAHGERPMLPLRFYSSERGKIDLDWIAVPRAELADVFDRVDQLKARITELEEELASSEFLEGCGNDTPVSQGGTKPDPVFTGPRERIRFFTPPTLEAMRTVAEERNDGR